LALGTLVASTEALIKLEKLSKKLLPNEGETKTAPDAESEPRS
jgi:hypothetical protein